MLFSPANDGSDEDFEDTVPLRNQKGKKNKKILSKTNKKKGKEREKEKEKEAEPPISTSSSENNSKNLFLSF